MRAVVADGVSELKLTKIFSVVLFRTLRWSMWQRDHAAFNSTNIQFVTRTFSFFEIALFLQESWLKARGDPSSTASLP